MTLNNLNNNFQCSTPHNYFQCSTPQGWFLPVSREDMQARGWDELDFLYISGDAYVDHPSFAPALICRLLE
ncbi:MAG: hypothetical protein IJ520_01640, partial [Synergistaceae bacterium]|nr:hypothetical protein [Synergistaceae bacterium]